MLQTLNDNMQQHAMLWGCEQGGVERAVQAWTPLQAWADARALLSTAAVHAHNLVVVNERDSVLELICPEGKREQPIWVVHFNDDHYSPVSIRSHDLLMKGLSTVPLVLWHHSANTAGGGLSLVRDDIGGDTEAQVPPTSKQNPQEATEISLQQWRIATNRWAKVREESRDGEGDEIILASVNAGGWQTNGATILSAFESPAICCVQETLLSQRTTVTQTKLMEKSGWKCIAGQGAEVKQTKRGYWKADRAVHPGLMICYHPALALTPVMCRTQNGRKWTDRGRIQIAHVSTPQKSHFLLFNIYAPAGNERREERRESHDDLVAEITSHGRSRIMVAGDFNDEVCETSVFGKLHC